MEFVPTEFVRKTFIVRAEEVNFKNVEVLAKWCKGKVDTETTKILGGAETQLPVVKFPGQGDERGKELIARLGYFIVESRGRFRVYKAPQFWAAFEKKFVTSVSPDHTDINGEPCKACKTLNECDEQHQGEGIVITEDAGGIQING
jgi:hypothetical protein